MSLAETPAEASRRLNNEAAMLHVKGEAEAARQRYAEAIAADHDNATAHNNLGYLPAQEGRVDDGIAGYQISLRLAQAANRLECSEAVLRRSDALTEATTERLVQLGTVVAARGRLAEAAKILQAGCEADPFDAGAWRQLGAVCFVRQDYGAATEALETAPRIAPVNAEALRHLYLTQLARGRRVEAKATLNRLLEAKPDDPGPCTDLALLRLGQGAYQLAGEILDEADKLPVAVPRTRIYHGLAHCLAGRRDDGQATPNALAAKGGAYAERALQQLDGLASP